MQIKSILRIIGALLLLFSISMLPPVIIANWYQDSTPYPFMIAFAVTFFTGALLWFAFHKHHKELKARDGFIVVILFWFVLCFFAAIPLMISDQPHDNLTDAMFESVSGFTTTGAAIVDQVDQLPHAMRYYRQQLQFLGGMGIIVLALAILPMLGVGGMQLYRAELPGPVKDTKLTPRLTETAKTLWYIYVGLTMLCALSYWLAGMSPFDALGESFSTISTGGFSMHSGGFAFYNSNTIELIASFFMFLGGTNFALHFIALHKASLKNYWFDEEFRTFFIGLFVFVTVTFIILLTHRTFESDITIAVKSVFNVVSLITTTGYTSANFNTWPSFIPAMLVFGAIVGGCAASTSGGIKVIRVLLLQKQIKREVHRLIHPNAVLTLRFGKESLPDYVLQAMWAFIAAFIGLFVVLLLALIATGLDFNTALGSLISSISNLGAVVGREGSNYAQLPVEAKWIMIFAMLAGRLEIFTLLVLFTPAFWRK